MIPPPPSPVDSLEHVLAGGTLLRRVHDPKRAGNVFNPGLGAPTRFAPFLDADGNVVPALYAAATPEAAVCESILHDVPISGGTLPQASYGMRVETALVLKRELRLAMIMGAGLRRLHITPKQLTATDGDVYAETVLWAQAAHAAGFDGIAWMSARDNTSEAYVLFGDRVASADLETSDRGFGLFLPGTAGFKWLSVYCSSVDVELLVG